MANDFDSNNPQGFHDNDKAFLERQGRMKEDWSGIYKGKKNGEQLVDQPYKWKPLPKLPPVKR